MSHIHNPSARRKTKNLAGLNMKPSHKPYHKHTIHVPSSIALLFSSIIITIITTLHDPSNHLVECSPPVDYFYHTSQLAGGSGATAAAAAAAGSKTNVLPSLESIYSTNDNNNDNQHQQQQLNELSSRVLAIVQNISHTHDNDLIDMETTSYAWHLMEKQALTYMRSRVNFVKPIILALLNESQVSDDCGQSIKSWLEQLKDLDQWATLMWNSWGEFPPAGLFEGSFTDLGSYRGCMSIKDNEIIGQSQYCTLDYQPLAPTRPRFHSIFKKVLDVDEQTGQMTNGDFATNNHRVSSSDSAHGFSSTRYRLLSGGGGAAGSGSGPETMMNKYNKRTIVGSVGDELTSKQAAAARNGSIGSTLTSGALIELAQKAQYFYYVKFRVGACLPSKCTQADVQKLAQTAGQRAILQANQVNCMKKEPFHMNGYQKVAVWILSTLAFIGLLGTITDLLGFEDKRNSSTLVSWLLQFSIWTNAKRLFDSDTAGTHADLECIHGLRFFSMLWVIYGHTILYTEYQSFTHFYDVVETQIPSFILLPSLNANFSVDTFFVISGILTTYVTWEYMKGDAKKFNKFAFAISRYIRLTPQLAIVILCFFLLPLFGDGPMYKQVTEDKAEVCYKNWAINLLYLQSYINSEKLCIDPSWWLSIEMSFHLLSMIVIIVMIQSPTRGMMVNFLVAGVLTIWGAIIHYTNGFAIQYLPSIPQRYEVTKEQTSMFFHRPYPHAAAYFIGIALGYILANRTIKKLTKSQVYQGWLVCSFGLIVSLWGSYYWNLGAPYTQLQSTLYYNLCQILWPISIAWIILSCSLGHGGFVESILSARCFVPLGRITYMTYLSHALIIYYHSASMSIPVEPSMLLFVYIFLANTFLSLILGVVLTVVYESPLLNLQKRLFTYLSGKFDPVNQDPHRSEMPRTIVCDKNGTSAASVMLLTNNKNGESIDGANNLQQKS